jgi:AraC-like DNA-binding protein
LTISLIRSTALTNYAEIAQATGLDPYRLVGEFGLPPRCLREPELRIPFDSVRRLLEASAERSGVDAFGLRMSEARRLSHSGPLGLLIREQPTLRLALEVVARYSHRVVEGLFLTVEETGDVVVLREELLVGRPAAIRQSTELAIGIVFRVLRAFLGTAWRPLRVCFVHDAPVCRSVHERTFGPNVDFNQAYNGIVFARADLEARNPDADPEIARLARQMLEATIPDDPAGTAAEARELVVTLVGTGSCTLKRAAQHLGVDPRTIQRHLASEGESFSGIVEAVRRELAERYLEDRHRPLAEVSSLLGFAAPSGLSRWYRQRFGVAPSTRRAALSRRRR